MPQLGSWRNNAQGSATDGSSAPGGGLLDPATHPSSATSGGYQPVNGANAAHGLHEALLQADTAVRSAANILTFGLADNLEARVDALAQGGTNGWGQRYQADLAQQHARNAYDTGHRRAAQLIGDVAGVGLSLISPVKGAAVARLPGAVGLTARDTAAILGAGAATGVVGQRAADLVNGQPSSWQDDVGAGIGGVAGAGSLFLGPQRAGAIGGAVTSAAQDVLNGRSISLEDAGEGAAAGGLFGRFAGNAGEQWSEKLPSKAKGRLGEALGDIRSTVNGLPRDWGPKAAATIAGTRKWWFPDGVSGDVRFEDKFGAKARLSTNQKMAQSALGDNFWLTHLLPEDIGKATSIPAAASAPIPMDVSRDQ
jgi:hypothetical protein